MIPRLARLSFAVFLIFAACAEGGSRGSGISTFVFGNVVSVQAPTETSLEAISVSVEGTRIHGVTDASGAFSLRGNFEGMVTMLFALPGDGGEARLTANIPANGTLTLTDVTIDTESGEALAETAGVEFDGVIVGVDCTAMIATMVSQHHAPDDVDQYRVRLDTSSVEDADGHPIACTALAVGDAASVDGTVNPDGTFGNATVVVGD